MNSMDCADIKALLSGLIDDEIDPETRHLAERHLGECRNCRDLLDDAEALDTLIVLDAEDSFGDLPADFEDAVLSRINEPTTGDPYVLRWTTWVGWMAAAASLTLALTIWVMQQNSTTPAGGPQGVAVNPGNRAPDPIGRDLDASPTQVLNAALTVPVYGNELDPFGVEQYALPETDDGLAPGRDVLTDAEATEIVREKSRELSALSDRPTMSADDAQTLYLASILLEMIAEADTDSFADIEMARQILEYDELLAKLRTVRDRMDAQDRIALFDAESIFTRILRGPLDLDDVRLLRETVLELNLHDEFAAMSARDVRDDAA